MPITKRYRTRKNGPRQANLQLDDALAGDDLLDLPLADDDPDHEPDSPAPRRGRRSWLWPPLILVALAAAAASGYYLNSSPPMATLSADLLDFGEVRLGTAADELTVEVRNQGQQKLLVSEAGLVGEAGAGFSVLADECSGREVARGQVCGLRLGFVPASRGAHRARLEILSNAVNGTETLPLLGSGVAPELAVEPARIDFGEQTVGTAGGVSRLWLANTGSAALAVDRIGLAGLAAADFVGLADACSGHALGPGERCAVDYRFVPTAAGLRRAEVEIISDAAPAGGSPWLVGIGLAREPLLRLDPERLDFGSWLVGEASPPRTVAILNEGDGALEILRVAASMAEITPVGGGRPRLDEEGAEAAGFELVGDACTGRSIPPGESCVLELVFRPRREGEMRAFFEIRHSAREGLHALPMGGTGTAPHAFVDPLRLSFGEVPVAKLSLPRVMRIVNSGTGPLRVRDLAVEGADRKAFAPPASGCAGATLRPDESCNVEIRFRPRRDGPHRAELFIRHSADRGFHRLPLNGLGVSARLTASPARIDLGDVRVNGARQQRLDLGNAGRAAVRIRRLRLAGSYAGAFELTGDRCSGRTLEPGDRCSVSVRFAPERTGTRNATIEIRHDAGSGPREVQVTATALPPP